MEKETKNCSKCNNIKKLTEFYKKKFKSGNIGYHSHCKTCKSSAKPKPIIDNDVSDGFQKCIKCNAIKLFNEYNKRKLRNGKITLRRECKACKNEYNKKYREENLEKIKEQQKEYCKNNRELKNETFNKRYNSDLNFKISDNLRAKLKGIKKKLILEKEAFNVINICSCDFNTLKNWFEYLFNIYYNKKLIWPEIKDDYEIDHITPVSSFDMSIEEEQKKAFKWSNLRIITKIENRNKANRIISDLIEKHKINIKNFIKINNIEI